MKLLLVTPLRSWRGGISVVVLLESNGEGVLVGDSVAVVLVALAAVVTLPVGAAVGAVTLLPMTDC